MQELARQRQYMEHSLNIMKDKSIRGEERMKTDVQRKVQENAALIRFVSIYRCFIIIIHLFTVIESPGY